MGEHAWLPMVLAPHDRRTTIRAKRWISGHDRMCTCC
jgi:hypothetical protein